MSDVSSALSFHVASHRGIEGAYQENQYSKVGRCPPCVPVCQLYVDLCHMLPSISFCCRYIPLRHRFLLQLWVIPASKVSHFRPIISLVLTVLHTRELRCVQLILRAFAAETSPLEDLRGPGTWVRGDLVTTTCHCPV